jgi:hypothetical protein
MRGFGPPHLHLAGIKPALIAGMLLSDLEAVASGGGLFEFGVDVTGVIMLAMAAKAQESGDDHLRTCTGAGALHGITEDSKAGYQIGAIDRMARHAIAGGAIDQIAAGELALIGSGIGILIIGDDQDERETFDSGLVDRFMKSAGRCGAVTETTGPHTAMQTFQSAGEKDPIDHGSHGAKMTDHRQQTFTGPATMHIAIAPAHGAQGRAERCADNVQNRFSKGEAACKVADERGKNISRPEREPEGHTQRLLAAAKKNAALDLARAVEAGQFIVQRAGEQHPAQGLEIRIAQGRRAPMRWGGDRLNHALECCEFTGGVQLDSWQGREVWWRKLVGWSASGGQPAGVEKRTRDRRMIGSG